MRILERLRPHRTTIIFYHLPFIVLKAMLIGLVDKWITLTPSPIFLSEEFGIRVA